MDLIKGLMKLIQVMAEEVNPTMRKEYANLICKELGQIDAWIDGKVPTPMPQLKLCSIISAQKLHEHFHLCAKYSSEQRWTELLGQKKVRKRQYPMYWINPLEDEESHIPRLLGLLYSIGMQIEDIKRIVFGIKGEWYVLDNPLKYKKETIKLNDIIKCRNERLIVPGKIEKEQGKKTKVVELYVSRSYKDKLMSDFNVYAPFIIQYRDEAIKAKIARLEPQRPKELPQSIARVVEIVVDCIDYNKIIDK